MSPERPERTPAIQRRLELAIKLGRETEQHRQRMNAAAEQRQDAIAWLLEHGYSQRALAEDLGVAPVVVQAAWEKARERRG